MERRVTFNNKHAGSVLDICRGRGKGGGVRRYADTRRKVERDVYKGLAACLHTKQLFLRDAP